jgi:hypothetical protein
LVPKAAGGVLGEQMEMFAPRAVQQSLGSALSREAVLGTAAKQRGAERFVATVKALGAAPPTGFRPQLLQGDLILPPQQFRLPLPTPQITAPSGKILRGLLEELPPPAEYLPTITDIASGDAVLGVLGAARRASAVLPALAVGAGGALFLTGCSKEEAQKAKEEAQKAKETEAEKLGEQLQTKGRIEKHKGKKVSAQQAYADSLQQLLQEELGR